MSRNFKKTLLGLAGGLALAGATSAQAAIIVTLPTGSPIQTPGYTAGYNQYTFSANVTSDEFIKTGSYFTIYDIPGLFNAPTAPAGFTASVNSVGQTPSNQAPNDDPNMNNVTFTYTGPQINGGSTPLGSFIINTSPNSSPLPSVLQYAALANKLADNTPDQNFGLLNVPGTLPPPSGVPLPAAVYAIPVVAAAAARKYRSLRNKA